jgi:hypothetical protein
VKMTWVSRFGMIALTLPVSALAQTIPAPSSCPLDFVNFNPSAVSVRVRNTSGKAIVGLSFYAALSDATEHWKWLHWNFDETKPLREFGWNKPIKPAAAKTLSWDRADLDFEHGGGGAFVLTSVLFDDGSAWEEPPDSASCKVIWLNGHKKSFVKPFELPLRSQ